MSRPGWALCLALALAVLISCAADAGDLSPPQDGLFLVYDYEGQLQTESGQPVSANPNDDQPNGTYISMPHVLLAGLPVPGAPSGQVEERQCAAACRAAPGCNIFQWCPDPAGCAGSLTGASTSAADEQLPWRHCELLQQPSAMPASSQPPKASRKGADVAITSGQVVPDMQPDEVPAGYTMVLAHSWYNRFDFVCTDSLTPTVCMRRGSVKEASVQCDADVDQCMGFIWYPFGRDYLGPGVYILKGVPDAPTPQNLPSIPFNLSLANWNGNAHLYSKNLTDAQVAELLQKTASMTWVQQPSIDASSGGAGLSAGAIAGIVVGCTAIAVILVAAVLVLRRRQKHPVSDAEATQRVLKGELHPGILTPDDITSMETSCTSGTTGSKKQSNKSQPDLISSTSTDLLASELGQEWVIHVSQLKFVQDKAGNPTKLGSGAQGVVYKALLNGCEPVAVKVIPLTGIAAAGESGGSAAAFAHEARMLHGLRHRCVVHLVGLAMHGDKAMLITEFMDGRDLFSMLGRCDRSGERVFGWGRRGKCVAVDVAAGLAYLHQKHVIHFDVKASNVMLTRNLNAKLGDVGLSKIMTHTFASQQGGVGTFAWCAPEVLQGKPCSYPADIYSFGVLLWEIVTGQVPLRGRLSLPRVPEQCPQEVVDLFLQCVQEDPAARPTARQLVQQLSALAGIQLAGNGLLSGEAGLYLAGSSSAIEEISMTPSPAPLLAVEATFQVAPVVAMRPSPFA